MKMPKRLKITDPNIQSTYASGYEEGSSQTHKEFTAYHNWRMGRLPSKEVIRDMLDDKEIRVFGKGDYLNAKITGKTANLLATALDKRIKEM